MPNRLPIKNRELCPVCLQGELQLESEVAVRQISPMSSVSYQRYFYVCDGVCGTEMVDYRLSEKNAISLKEALNKHSRTN